jgi:hypothetical protein
MQQDHYRKKAAECLRAAGRIRDPGERLNLLGVARQFALLAAHVGARHDRGEYGAVEIRQVARPEPFTGEPRATALARSSLVSD